MNFIKEKAWLILPLSYMLGLAGLIIYAFNCSGNWCGFGYLGLKGIWVLAFPWQGIFYLFTDNKDAADEALLMAIILNTLSLFLGSSFLGKKFGRRTHIFLAFLVIVGAIYSFYLVRHYAAIMPLRKTA